jgi:hypothetical protein
MNDEKTIYKETIGNATIAILQVGRDTWRVTLVDDSLSLDTSLEFGDYSNAINVYDNTVMAAAKIYNVTAPSIGLPEFGKTIEV